MMQCCRKVASGSKAAGALRSLVNARGPQLEYARVLYEGMLVSALLYGSKTDMKTKGEVYD